MRAKIAMIAQNLLPSYNCVLCNEGNNFRSAICKACIHSFSRLGYACYQCARPLPDSLQISCGNCLKNKPFIDHTRVSYLYQEPLRSILHQFKYNQGLYLGDCLSNLIVDSLGSDYCKPECLIPVPMHPHRLRQRGFNQAVILAKLLKRKLQIPVDYQSCKKVFFTVPQAELDGLTRTKNLRNSFNSPTLPYSHVAIIDDLITTGSTANEMAKALKIAGVKHVQLWCCARTKPQ